MADQSNQQSPDLIQLWRDWLTQSERQFNAFFNDMMNSEGFARSIGGGMEMYTSLQRAFAQAMERYLAMVNMPSRTDIIALGETLRTIEDRLSRIEETLQIAAEAVDAAEPGAASSEPARTRRPARMPIPGEAVERAFAIPEELRR